MKKIRLILTQLSVCLFILFGCKKQAEPILQSGPSLFVLNGNLEGENISVEAGKNSFYMYSNFEREANNTLLLKANLKQTCSDCKESYEFIFRANNDLNIPQDSMIKKGKYKFFKNDVDSQISYKVKFRADHFNQPIISYLWRFPDGSTSNDSTPTKTYTQPQTLQVILLCKYASNCQADINLPIRINKGMVINPLKFNYTFVQGTNRYITFVPVLTDTIVNGKFIWEFGDGKTSETFGSVNHFYTDSGAYKVCIKTQYLGDTLSYCQRIKTPDKKNCIANFSSSQNIEVNNPNFYSIEINYIDANGNRFSSKDLHQDVASFFEVLTSENYLKNEINQNTKSLDIKFNCNLKGNSGIRKMQNFQGKIAVAIP
jgi:hypothetical protein